MLHIYNLPTAQNTVTEDQPAMLICGTDHQQIITQTRKTNIVSNDRQTLVYHL